MSVLFGRIGGGPKNQPGVYKYCGEKKEHVAHKPENQHLAFAGATPTHLFNKKPGKWWEKKSGLNEGE